MTAKRTATKIEITGKEKESMDEILSGILELLDDMSNNDTIYFKEENGAYVRACFEKDKIQSFADFLAYCIDVPAVLE